MGKILEKPINKENTMLNIIMCNFNRGIEMNFLDKKENIEPKEYTHQFYGWKFYDYGQNINEALINQIINKLIDFCSSKKFKNVLLIYDNKPRDDNNNSSLLIMKQIIRHSNEILFQPLMIYVSDTIEKNKLYYRKILKDYILNENIEEGEEFDKLNISSILYDPNNFTNKLISELWKCTIYFNQIPSMYLPMKQEDENFEIKVQKYPNTLNILLAGETGTGKSSFINILNDGKIAYESDNGIFKTNKINEYLISYKLSEINSIINQHENNLNQNQQDRQFNYKICDTVGFSLENKELKDLIAFIKEYNEEQIRTKDRIVYFILFKWK